MRVTSLLLAISVLSAGISAAPLCAQAPEPMAVTGGMEIQVRRTGDSTWSTVSTGEIIGMTTCVLVRQELAGDHSGDYQLISFKHFTGVRVKDRSGEWQAISTDELARLQRCVVQ